MTFTFKRVIRTYSQMHNTDKYSQHISIIWPVWLGGWVFVYELNGCGFEPSSSHFKSPVPVTSTETGYTTSKCVYFYFLLKTMKKVQWSFLLWLQKMLKTMKHLPKILFDIVIMDVCLVPCFYIPCKRQLESVTKVSMSKVILEVSAW